MECARAVRRTSNEFAEYGTGSTLYLRFFALVLFPTYTTSAASAPTRYTAPIHTQAHAMSTIKRPIQIEEFIVSLRDVPDEQLYSIKRMIAQYIAKLHKTNTKLDKLAKGEDMDDESDGDDEFNEVGPEDKELFKEIIVENVVVVRNYEQRIEAVDNELTHRGLPVDSSKTPEALKEAIGETVSIPSVHGANQVANTDNDDGDTNAPNSLLL